MRQTKHSIKVKGGEEQMEQRIILHEYTCERCGHTWIPRSRDKPKVCPGCNSPYWDRPRKKPSERNENEKK